MIFDHFFGFADAEVQLSALDDGPPPCWQPADWLFQSVSVQLDHSGFPGWESSNSEVTVKTVVFRPCFMTCASYVLLLMPKINFEKIKYV